MRRPVDEMTREELVRELPKRLLAMMVFLAFVFAVAISVSFIAVRLQMSLFWIAALVGVVLAAPFGISKMFAWTLAPAHERIRRRKAMMQEALASVRWSGGDYEV